MSKHIRQQIVISGVGGQGVLFVTRLLAEAAIQRGLSVFTSETHGMAQRGGTVISHLKVGTFSSPLIRPKEADGVLALQAENVLQHGFYLKSDAWLVVNGTADIKPDISGPAFTLDATRIAQQIGTPKSANLVVLGFAMARTSGLPETEKGLFCSKGDIITVLENRLADNKEMLDAAIRAIETGYGQ